MKLRLLGVNVTFHWSLMLIVLMTVYGVVQHTQARIGYGLGVLCGVLCASVVLFSILFHEFAHILVGRRFGVRFSNIILFALGGAAKMDNEIPNAKSEFWMALAGPVSSVALFGATYPLLAHTTPYGFWFTLVSYASIINLVMAVSNMLPFLPLDGGRILRSVLWFGKDHLSATTIASMIGQAGGAVFIFMGILAAFGETVPLVGSRIGGIMFALVGAFIASGAKRELEIAKLPSVVRELKRLTDAWEVADYNNDCVVSDKCQEQIDQFYRGLSVLDRQMLEDHKGAL
jgi:Zn-dependent protease